MSDLTDRLAALEMTLVEMLAKCSWAKREQWCGCIDCHCVLARRALRHGSAPRRADAPPDKINEAFKRATTGATWWKKMLTALVLLCSIGRTDCRQIAESPDQS
jgi:hypothetical protein